MATKQVKRYEVVISLTANNNSDCNITATYWVPEATTRGLAAPSLEGAEVEAVLEAAKAAVNAKLAEDGSTVEGI